jgi:hypothetical protein
MMLVLFEIILPANIEEEDVTLPATGESVSVIIPKSMVVMATEDPREEIWHGSVISALEF